MTLEKATRILSESLKEYDSLIGYELVHLACSSSTNFRADCVREILSFDNKNHLFSEDTLDSLHTLLNLKYIYKKDILNTYMLMCRDLNLEE